MKHISKHFIFILSWCFILASCEMNPVFDNDFEDSSMIPLNITGSINQKHTKATSEGFVDKDAVGLFAVNYTDNNTVAGALLTSGNQADNVKYVFDESSRKWIPNKKVYYKDVNTNVDIYLYYPYQSSISSIEEANFEVKKDQSKEATSNALSGYEASDFLWGKSAGVIPSEQSVAVSLSHKLSAVEVTLTEGTGFGSGEFSDLDKSVIITNTTRKATINYATGVASAVGSPQADGIVMCPQSNGQFRAIVIPQTVNAGSNLFAITIDKVAYGFTQPADVQYKAGKQMNVNIVINKKSPSGDYEFVLGDSQITDWTEDNNAHGGEARQYFVVSVTDPGTLGQLIKAAGKNPDKIRNLKVVGNVKDNDFYFMRDSMAILESINMKEAVIKGSGKEITHAYKYWSDYDIYIKNYGEPDYESGDYVVWYENDGFIPNNSFKNKKTLCNFAFPEYVIRIGDYSFSNTTLSGALIIPEDVESINYGAFSGTAITSITFNGKLVSIGNSAFAKCTALTGSLVFPETLERIGSNAFQECSFSGRLLLPERLTSIGTWAFYKAGKFTEGLSIPDGVTSLEQDTFVGCGFTGELKLNNVTSLGNGCFDNCTFTGTLTIPDGMIEIPQFCFYSSNNFTKIIFPESLRKIGSYSFRENHRLEEIVFNEGLLSIDEYAFYDCSTLLSLTLPESIQTISGGAFGGCYYISNITCKATTCPNIKSNTFNGVAKDNIALEVPAQSIGSYSTDAYWGEFKRITAHYDFSIGRMRMRALNEEMTRTFTLRCPSGMDWSISGLPEWVTVSPASGTGKTDVTITVSEMARTTNLFEVNDGSVTNPSYKKYKGRSGQIVFSLNEKGYTCTLDVEQYDYDKADGQVITHQTATKGNGIDIVFIGEGYDAKDIAKGTFETNAAKGYEHFFAVEPYKTYKDYFNVYSVVSLSPESGIENVNIIKDNKFTKNGVINLNDCFNWAKKADNDLELAKTVVILLENTPQYYGWTYMYGDGSSLAVVPISTEASPYDFRGLIQHEAGGHAFGKLGDEYIYHNAYITSCNCVCCDHPSNEYDTKSSYGFYKTLGWFKNLSMISDHNQVPWSHLLYHSKYSDRVDMYEGAYMHTRVVYRSEITSCMNNNVPYYNSISRQAIVERIKAYAGETFDFNDFVANDKFDVGPTKGPVNATDWTFGLDPRWNRGTEKGSIIYMGEHPDVK